jgi:hypothetical protein
MKRLYLAVAVSCLVAPPILAQEHFTEGPVWVCGAYRTKQGHFDDYMKYLRESFVPQTQESKKAGLILDSKVYLHVPETPNDPDVLICTLHASFGKALDYDAAADAKGKDIASKHFKTADEEKQREIAAKRFAFRDFIGTSHYREVNLKPLP